MDEGGGGWRELVRGDPSCQAEGSVGDSKGSSGREGHNQMWDVGSSFRSSLWGRDGGAWRSKPMGGPSAWGVGPDQSVSTALNMAGQVQRISGVYALILRIVWPHSRWRERDADSHFNLIPRNSAFYD